MSAEAAAAALATCAAAVAAFRAAPLSRKKAMLAALLVDAALDAQFVPTPGRDDILDYRAGRMAASPALALVADLAAMRLDGPRLIVESVEVPLADYNRLSVEDFMVSLYNHHSVQRVRIALPDSARHDAVTVLSDALAELMSQADYSTPYCL